MGRAIKPVAIRRERSGGPVEVQGVSGFWVKHGLLSEAGLSNLDAALNASEFGDVIRQDMTGSHTFLYTLGAGDPQEYENKYKNEDAPPPPSGDPQDQGESQSDGSSGGGSMEDIVRRIAGEMDATMLDGVVKGLSDYVTHQELAAELEAFQPKQSGEGGIYSIITKIEFNMPDPKELDGLFHNQFPTLMKCVQAGKHTFLPGPPGTGKSHAAEQVATALGWGFASMSFGPTTPESRLWGGMDAHGKFFEPPFVTGARYAQDNPESGFIFCMDEMDNGHAGIIATTNSALANGWFTAPNGDVITMGRNFVIVAAANTYGTGPTAEFSGRNKLDAATLDRFVYIPWDTDLAVETALVHQWLDDIPAKGWLNVWRTARKNVETNGLKQFVTMRGCVSGAQLIAGGFSAQEAFALVLGNKVPADQLRKISPF